MKPLLFTIFSPPPKTAKESESTKLYFYYSDPEIEKQSQDDPVLRVNFIHAFTTIREYMKAGKPTFITTTKLAIAIKVIDNIFFLLGGDVNTPETVVTNSLHLLLDYFHFYYSTVKDIQTACKGDRNAFKYQMQEIGARLLSILFFIYPDTISQQFNPIPYCPLPMVL